MPLVAQKVKRLPTMQETQVWFLGQEDPLEKEMATYSSTLAWKIPWTEDPGRLQFMGSQRVEHDWETSLSLSLLFKSIFLVSFPRWLSGKESSCQFMRHRRCGFDPWVRKIPRRRKWQPTSVFFPGESHGQSLAGYSQSIGSQRIWHDWAT